MKSRGLHEWRGVCRLVQEVAQAVLLEELDDAGLDLPADVSLQNA